MPHARSGDGVGLYYEEAGSGTPIVFVHEFAGDHRSWEPQLRFLSRWFRCIAYNARGYPPSDVPDDPAAYSQAHARDDVVAVLDHLGIERAHVVGLSMGGFATLHVGLAHPGRARSLVVAGCGYGAAPGAREKFIAECGAVADMFEREGIVAATAKYTAGPTRVPYRRKDPRGFAAFVRQMGEHSAAGHALTMRGVQMRRPSLWDLVADMRGMRVPTLIVAGDEDEPCLEPALLMKREIPGAALWLVPRTGHAVNLEEPDAFNRAVLDFLTRVELGRS
jgi:pimeloyl-ACP methyl ester carboxylesterase